VAWPVCPVSVVLATSLYLFNIQPRLVPGGYGGLIPLFLPAGAPPADVSLSPRGLMSLIPAHLADPLNIVVPALVARMGV